MSPMKHLERRSLRFLAHAALAACAALPVHAQDAAALAGEDLFVVTLSNPVGNLNVRKQARANSDAVGRLPNGAVVRNAGGCERSENSYWCEVEARDGGLRGWVSGKYLTPATPESVAAASAPPAAVVEPAPAEDVAPAEAAGPAVAAAPDEVAPPAAEPAETAVLDPAAMLPDDIDDGPVQPEEVVLAAGVPSGALDGVLTPDSSTRYILGAKNGQSLEVHVLPYGPGLSFRILNADGSVLQDKVDAAQSFAGQLDRGGDLVIEVSNTGDHRTTYMLVYAVN